MIKQSLVSQTHQEYHKHHTHQSSDNMIKPEYKYSELTGKIIGCTMEVHNSLGNGFQAVIYQERCNGYHKHHIHQS